MDENLSRGYVQLRRPPHLRPPVDPDRAAPRDKYNLIYAVLLLAGVGFLLPYNSFVIAVDFFQQKYPGTTIVFDMSLVYIGVSFVTVLLNNVLVNVLPMHSRIGFGYMASFTTMLLVALCQIRWDLFERSVSYKVSLLAVAIVAMGCTIQQSSFYGYTSMLPSRFTQAVMIGESAAGLLVCLNRILTKSLVRDERINTLVFFLVSVVIVAACSIFNSLIQSTDFVAYHVNRCRQKVATDGALKKISLQPAEDADLVDFLEASGTAGKYKVVNVQSPAAQTTPDSAFQSSENIQPHASSFDNPLYKDKYEESAILDLKLIPSSVEKSFSNPNYDEGLRARIRISRIIWPYMVSIALVYFVTLSLFPGIESEIVSCRLKSWMPVLIMTIFNLFDFIGKVTASMCYKWNSLQLLLSSCIRLILIPLIMLCASHRGSPLIQGEGWAFLFSLVLGITNGIFGSLPMIIAPSKVSDEDKEMAGNIMTLSYIVGLTSGSAFAYLLDFLLGPSLHSSCIRQDFSTLPNVEAPAAPMTTPAFHAARLLEDVFLLNRSAGSGFAATNPANVTAVPAGVLGVAVT